MFFAVGLQRGIFDGEAQRPQVVVGRRTGESSLGVVEDGDLGRVFGEKGVITMKSMMRAMMKLNSIMEIRKIMTNMMMTYKTMKFMNQKRKILTLQLI